MGTIFSLIGVFSFVVSKCPAGISGNYRFYIIETNRLIDVRVF